MADDVVDSCSKLIESTWVKLIEIGRDFQKFQMVGPDSLHLAIPVIRLCGCQGSIMVVWGHKF